MFADNLKILTIDDNPDNLTVLNAVIKDAFPNARVIRALNGPDGIDLAISENPDVIILDIVLPEMDGFEVCLRLKRDERVQHIPVIFLTALRTDRISRIRALEVGAEGFLGKPFDEEELTAQIRAMSKIKAANEFQRMEKEQLADMVAERTISLENELAERKKAEEALRASEQKYRNLFENSPIGILLVDSDGRILEINQALLNSLGSPSLDYTKKINIFELPQLVESGVSDLFRSCMAHDRHVRAELPYTSKWGKSTYMRILLTPMKDGHGKTCGCQAVLEDVSEQKNLERELHQAQKMEAVGTLAGGIAHDFNNLLQVTIGYAELLLTQKRPDDSDYAAIQNIYQTALSGADLVRRLMMFSRKIEPKLVRVNLNNQIDQISKFLSRTIPKMIDIRLETSDAIDLIHADPTQIEQIIMNLAVNARDAMPEGGTLTIVAQNAVLGEHDCKDILGGKPGNHVLLTVSDTGCGMDQETVNRIFEPFFTTKESGRGTGLGLASVYGIVQNHGGYISCTSEPSKGTVFKIYFPSVACKKELSENLSESIPVGGSETILLVEDEESVCFLTKQLLSKAGYQVLTASNGLEAIHVYQNRDAEIDIVILDLMMPKMGGIMSLKELLKINPNVKVLIASGLSAGNVQRECTDIGAKGFVQKPFSASVLLGEIRKALD